MEKNRWDNWFFHGKIQQMREGKRKKYSFSGAEISETPSYSPNQKEKVLVKEKKN